MSQKLYEVRVVGTVTKDILVQAESKEEAGYLAHTVFSIQKDRWPEKYDEQTINTREVTA